MSKGQVQKSIKMLTTYGVESDIQIIVERSETENGGLIVSKIDIIEPHLYDTVHITQKQARCLLGILKTMELDGVM